MSGLDFVCEVGTGGLAKHREPQLHLTSQDQGQELLCSAISRSVAAVKSDNGECIWRLTLDQEIGGSTPPAPASAPGDAA